MFKERATSSARTQLFSTMSEKSQPHFVRVSYQGQTLKLPTCADAGRHRKGSNGQLCTFEAFSEALRKYAIGRKDWQLECAKPLDSPDAI